MHSFNYYYYYYDDDDDDDDDDDYDDVNLSLQEMLKTNLLFVFLWIVPTFRFFFAKNKNRQWRLAQRKYYYKTAL